MTTPTQPCPRDQTGDGFDPHPLLVAPGDWRTPGAAVSGEIRDGRGYHPLATFVPTRRSLEIDFPRGPR